MSTRTIRIGTRGSKLALWQANTVKTLLEQAAPDYDYELTIIHTKGDKILDVALAKIGDKGLFTKELEVALLTDGIDLCVHSCKDMPTQLPEGLCIAGMPERALPNDVLVGPAGTTLENLPVAARVATGSLRRVAQLRHLRGDLTPCEIRGNVDSRVKRMESDEFDAGILAAAGMQRLGLDEHIAQVIPTDVMIPAVGQGAMAIEIRKNDRVVGPLCDAITDPETWRAVTAERHVLCALEGGCQVPMGAYAHRTESGNFALDAFVASLDGERFLRTHVEGEAEQSQALAQQVVDELLAQGAQAIIEELR